MRRFEFPIQLIQEGKAKVWTPKTSGVLSSKMPVFYNPVMELNRDIAVLALQTFLNFLGRKIDVCEPLTGCGVRGIRFALETKNIGHVFLNDINKNAVALARLNIKENNVAKLVTVENLDANLFLSLHAAPRKRFDFIDVDPFGSPAPYMDSTVRAIRNGGMIALTATDMAPLCGVHPKACIRKYGGKPLRTEYSHELAVRLLAGCLATTAAKHDIGIEIVFCHSTDHYIRIFAIANYGAQKADQSIKEIGFVLHCFNCFHRETAKGLCLTLNQKCPECHNKLTIGGPLWLGKLFDKNFCLKMEKELSKKNLRQEKRILKLLTSAKKEANAPATYYVIDRICDKYGLPAPPTKNIIQQLKKTSYTAQPTHFHRRGIKTKAPAETMKKIIMKENK